MGEKGLRVACSRARIKKGFPEEGATPAVRPKKKMLAGGKGADCVVDTSFQLFGCIRGQTLSCVVIRPSPKKCTQGRDTHNAETQHTIHEQAETWRCFCVYIDPAAFVFDPRSLLGGCSRSQQGFTMDSALS